MTTTQVYKMAGVENELLNHIKSRKLRYFGHVMRHSHDNVERRSRGRGEKPWKTTNVLVGQYLPVD